MKKKSPAFLLTIFRDLANFRFLNRDLRAPFIATTLQNNLSGFAAHSRAKTVNFGAFARFRLKCPLWHI
jgi:hypothetical protein